MGFVVYFLSFFYKTIPIGISFILLIALLIMRDYSNLLYLFYMNRLSTLENNLYKKEFEKIYLFSFISFIIFILTGILMNLLLESPNMGSGFVQVFFLFCLFIINEFEFIYKIIQIKREVSNKEFDKLKKDYNFKGIFIPIILENAMIIFTLTKFLFFS